MACWWVFAWVFEEVYGGGRVGRLVRLFDGGVGFDGRVVVGGHGVGGGCDRVLSPVDVFNGYPFRLEMGFDVGVVFRDGFEPPVRFVKVYFSRRDFIRSMVSVLLGGLGLLISCVGVEDWFLRLFA